MVFWQVVVLTLCIAGTCSQLTCSCRSCVDHRDHAHDHDLTIYIYGALGVGGIAGSGGDRAVAIFV